MQTLTIKGLAIQLPDSTLEQLVLERLEGDETRKPYVATAPGTLPRIGAEIAELGGVFAGVVRGLNGAADYYLIVGPESPSAMERQPANEWADTVEHLGFSDFSNFTRREQAICFGNVPELFKKEWYWSSEQHAGNSDFAWAQLFGNGYQDFFTKGYDFRARAVRRVPIQ